MMGESTKAVLALLLIVGAVGSVFPWMADRPDGTTWAFRIVLPGVAALALGVLLALHFRRDLAPDYLRQRAGTYFNRDGFAFALAPAAVEGVAYVDLFFENQFDRPCVGRVAVRPARSFFLNRANIEALTYQVECASGAFGRARLALPIPQAMQGKRQSFEVGAAVRYPNGKGKRLRFHDGLLIRANSDFGNDFGTALTVAGALGGMIVLSSPATASVELPKGVAEDFSAAVPSKVETFWKVEDPPLAVERIRA